jgi:RecG-like helicase
MKMKYITLLIIILIPTISNAQIEFFNFSSCQKTEITKLSENELNQLILFFNEKYSDKEKQFSINSLSDNDVCHIFMWSGVHEFTPNEDEQYFNIRTSTKVNGSEYFYSFYFTIKISADETVDKPIDIYSLFNNRNLTNYYIFRVNQKPGSNLEKIELNGVEYVDET